MISYITDLKFKKRMSWGISIGTGRDKDGWVHPSLLYRLLDQHGRLKSISAGIKVKADPYGWRVSVIGAWCKPASEPQWLQRFPRVTGFFYWVTDLKGGTHFIISFLWNCHFASSHPPLCLRVEQPTHWTGSTVITGEKEARPRFNNWSDNWSPRKN